MSHSTFLLSEGLKCETLPLTITVLAQDKFTVNKLVLYGFVLNVITRIFKICPIVLCKIIMRNRKLGLETQELLELYVNNYQVFLGSLPVLEKKFTDLHEEERFLIRSAMEMISGIYLSKRSKTLASGAGTADFMLLFVRLSFFNTGFIANKGFTF